ncbi:uncharacterized protein MYCFIDRAFT_42207 [Pseudocercospora fijiensis CIRAD86]|uniref:Carbohydrate kinase PfkB domain-containing protein n=1 Tax=Pseudocercospora fijiensis (strain CIRAD86) TaxID=383855 RepID=M3AIQ8_PSEFD|nr:uncharacterized protein MYCFIDRAFT_42207 [Pseudocercospora fijiensis CIRAD86]EME77347.1 hypothetical protein MYCFIDRAFT_42207 [Pseudocercospora fijiensis CIRAD86]
MAAHDHDVPLFVSMGMVVLDEVHLPDGQVLPNVVGGSMPYSTVGACLAVDEADVHRICCFLLAGHDFPQEATKEIESWGVDLEIQNSEGRVSTRGKLQYHDQGFATSAFHFVASPDQLTLQVKDLLEARKEAGITTRPFLAWEPAPMHCRPNSLAAHVEASKLVDVFSPNHQELDALCGRLKQQADRPDCMTITGCAAAFMEEHFHAFGPHQLVIIRAAEHGSLVARRTTSGDELQDTVDMTWVVPYYSGDDQHRIKDATGAGSAFLGAFAVEFQQNGGDAVEATAKASVAASFAVEQIGLPTKHHSSGRRTSKSEWNGTTVAERMKEYEHKTSKT